MRFRLKAFAAHLLCSACALTVVLGSLWLGWYRWPGWYLAGVVKVAGLVVGIDLALGPLLTLVIASPSKARRALARDIAMIVLVQLIALGYGAVTLWYGRPLYYAFSGKEVSLVQASALRAAEITRARKENPTLAPHWYSVPRWVWTPLPADPEEAAKIVLGTVVGEPDISQLPRYYRPLGDAHDALAKALRKVDDTHACAADKLARLKERMQRLGVAADAPATLPVLGRAQALLAVFEPGTLAVRGILRCD